MPRSKGFVTTRWSLVEAATGSDPVASREALDKIVRLYQIPCEEWLRSKGFGAEQAEEICQSFMCDVVLQRELLSGAGQSGVPLRARVKRALGNHATDCARRSGARDRHETRAAQEATQSGPATRNGTATRSNGTVDAERSFDKGWARAQLAEAIARLRASSLESRHTVAWRAFELRVLIPAMHGRMAPAYEVIAREIGVVDAARAAVLVQEMRMRALRSLDQVISETASDPAEVKAELEWITECLEEGVR